VDLMGWTVGRGGALGLVEEAPPVSHDWSDANPPWAYTDASDWESRLPAGVPVVNLSGTGATFWDKLNNTVNGQSGRFICRLPAGDHVLTSFRLIGGSGDPSYAMGFWFPKLAGLTGAGPDQTYVTMAANSMTQAQLDKLATMTYASFAENQMSMFRIDSSVGPAFLGGLTVRAHDQQMLTSKAADVPIVVPQPAPHRGAFFYPNGQGTISHVRFQGAGRACTSRPPFEHANATSQYGSFEWFNCEFDGRRSPDIDPLQPRRCGVWMGNNETLSRMTDCWMHHSNVSRYAANDENADTSGLYELIRCVGEEITNNRNTDPNLNGGNSLLGYSNPSVWGWESTKAELRITDCITRQDNNVSDSFGTPQHINLTQVGGHNPAGGRLYVTGGTWENAGFPTCDGFVCFRIVSDTRWYIDGLANTVYVYHPDGQRLTPWTTTSWPPSAGTLSAAGVTPESHYLVKTN
jgi:hypothetical protein